MIDDFFDDDDIDGHECYECQNDCDCTVDIQVDCEGCSDCFGFEE